MDRVFRIDFYPQDWLIDTAKLSPEERGVYIQIICLIYANRGPIENDPRWIGGHSGCSTRKATAIISQLFQRGFLVENGAKISQKRAENELEIKRKHLENSSKGGRKRAENEGKNNKNNDIVSSGACESQPAPSPSPSPNPHPYPKTKNILSSKLDDVCRDLLCYLNEKTGKRFRPAASNMKLLRARLNEGHAENDIRAVIDRKCMEWAGTDFCSYLRPATLFGAEKFNQYVGELGQPTRKPIGDKNARPLTLTEQVQQARDKFFGGSSGGPSEPAGLDGGRIWSSIPGADKHVGEASRVGVTLDGDFSRQGSTTRTKRD